MSDSILDNLFGPGAHDVIVGPVSVPTWCGEPAPPAQKLDRAAVMNLPATRIIYRPADLAEIGADENTIRRLMEWPKK